MSVDHYENFPVASLLCPARLRPPIAAIYWFARTADDLADEGDAPATERLADLAAYRQALQAAASGAASPERWRAVFEPLRQAITRFALPLPLLEALLSAFEQDVVKDRYADRHELLDYCKRSANPVGRLLLHLHGIDDAAALAQSDAICSALQLINFWQDLSIDTIRGRLYIPEADLQRHALQTASVMARDRAPEVVASLRRVIAELVDWSRALMLGGAPLVHRLPGRSGWELRLVVQGGLRILRHIERLDHDVIGTRPKLGALDGPAMLWGALTMPSHSAAPRSEAA